ncbi:hypothetical protein [Finegoldia magna]|uniref:hypothetical protein n=1 Tax=Finegoldia magna TaxID=1260 RepID=UPI00290068C4|nr:hypothetical protein [Finegoldia magna]MDU2219288.1 hypothetical protein [Finegoldia magna]
MEIKLNNKKKLAKYILDTTGIEVDPTSIFPLLLKLTLYSFSVCCLINTDILILSVSLKVLITLSISEISTLYLFN